MTLDTVNKLAIHLHRSQPSAAKSWMEVRICSSF